MTYEEMMKDIKKHEEEREAYRRGEIEDGMSEECRHNWIEKCNSQFSRESLSHTLANSIGKKINIRCNDGKEYSGYIFEYSLAENSDIGEESITLAPLDKEFQIEIPTKDIVYLSVDPDFESFE